MNDKQGDLMKKRRTFSSSAYGIAIIVVLVIFMIAGGIYLYIDNHQNDSDSLIKTDAFRFQNEYESLNGQEIDNTNRTYLNVTINKNNPVKYASYEEVMNILESGTGIIYFGYPECPWCRTIVPVLLEAAEAVGLEPIYYYNAKSIRDVKHLDENGNIVVDQEGTKEYYDLIEAMSEVLTPYEGLNDDTIKRLYFPTIIAVKNGVIQDIRISSVDSQTDPYTSLTDEQHQELLSIYKNMMKRLLMCDTDTAC